ncbi:MAG: hypothetical protein JW717_06655 [Marinilabiliaceae bacterium]|nr:hypothetical protein [Marinilabiliaceae bacterium]
MQIRAENIRITSFVNFRQWSRKGYAIFASLKKVVRIAVLKLAVSDRFIEKGESLKTITYLNNGNDFILDDFFDIETILLNPDIFFAVIKSDNYNGSIIVCNNTMNSPVDCCRQGF